MGAPRRKNLLANRRRTDDDGEDETLLAHDSSSASVPSDVDDDADAEGSDGSARKRGNRSTAPQKEKSGTKPFTTRMADTEAMMNGLNLEGNEGESINFDDAGETGLPLNGRRKEHEEYKRKRDGDPSFVPNRGGFFMHDQRSSHDQNGYRGRGRGRGRIPPIPSQYVHHALQKHVSHRSRNGDTWAHDLHDSVKLDPPKPEPRLPLAPSESTHPNRSFSCTTQLGNVQVRVCLPLMQAPVVIPGMAVNQHTRLPHHRPPLRRDKPVRISLPDRPPRYIFPIVDRSFIFIPRALRPNHQGFGRGRGKGSFSGFPSGRTSLYGGSIYSPSLLSRRSSMARDTGYDGHISPAGSTVSSRPVVRLPPSDAPQPVSYSSSPAPIVNLPQPLAYPLPPKPITHHFSSSLPMHQPRPQKQVSVADIETPAALHFHPPPQQHQQPFHQQVPAAVNGQNYQDPNHWRRPSHPSQRGTPLSQIPERAVHAPAFQAYPVAQPFYPMQYPPVYYYPPPTGPSMAPSPFAPGQQYPFVLPTAPPTAPLEATSQPATVAHESNGMVYYFDSSQLAGPNEEGSFQPVAFAPPNGYVMPPSAVYYPPT